MRVITSSVVMLLLASSMISGCMSEPKKVDSEEDIPVAVSYTHLTLPTTPYV